MLANPHVDVGFLDAALPTVAGACFLSLAAWCRCAPASYAHHRLQVISCLRAVVIALPTLYHTLTKLDPNHHIRSMALLLLLGSSAIEQMVLGLGLRLPLGRSALLGALMSSRQLVDQQAMCTLPVLQQPAVRRWFVEVRGRGRCPPASRLKTSLLCPASVLGMLSNPAAALPAALAQASAAANSWGQVAASLLPWPAADSAVQLRPEVACVAHFAWAEGIALLSSLWVAYVLDCMGRQQYIRQRLAAARREAEQRRRAAAAAARWRQQKEGGPRGGAAEREDGGGTEASAGSTEASAGSRGGEEGGEEEQHSALSWEELGHLHFDPTAVAVRSLLCLPLLLATLWAASMLYATLQVG